MRCVIGRRAGDGPAFARPFRFQARIPAGALENEALRERRGARNGGVRVNGSRAQKFFHCVENRFP